jgi:epsilon-lactone hydrolase
MYRYLLDVEGVAPQNILLVGESAGADLSLATLMRVRDSNPAELPCGAVFSSPFVDLEMRGDERSTPYCVLADRIVDISCSIYVPGGGCPETWGDASTVHCNLSGLPAAYIITREFDHLLLHAQRLMERAKKRWGGKLAARHPRVHAYPAIYFAFREQGTGGYRRVCRQESCPEAPERLA